MRDARGRRSEFDDGDTRYQDYKWDGQRINISCGGFIALISLKINKKLNYLSPFRMRTVRAGNNILTADVISTTVMRRPFFDQAMCRGNPFS